MNIGEASILNLLLARATRGEHYCALVDVCSVFDMHFSAEMEADLEKLLWVRCGGARTEKQVAERVALLSRPMSLELVMAGALDSRLIDMGILHSGGVLAGLMEGEMNMPKPVQSVSVAEQKMVVSDGGVRTLKVEPIGDHAMQCLKGRELRAKRASSNSLAHHYALRVGSHLDLKQQMKPLERAFKCADILLQNGGFGLIAVDLSGVDERLLRKVPKATWFRFSRVAEKTQTTLVFLAAYPAGGNCSVWTLRMKGMRALWSGSAGAPHTNILTDVAFGAEVTRSRRRGKAEFAKVFSAPPKIPAVKVPAVETSAAFKMMKAMSGYE